MQYGVCIIATETKSLTIVVEAESAEEGKAKVRAAMEKRTEPATEVTALEIDGKTETVHYIESVEDDFEINDVWDWEVADSIEVNA